jgi:putative heme iron utilization protein
LNAGDTDERSAAAGFTARCLLRQCRWATLATQSGGQPAASLVTHAVAPDGTVLMLLSSLSEHARHLAAEPRCALMAAGAPENLNWQTAPRVTVSGRASPLDDRQARRYWVGRHPYARLYADFVDFSIWRLVPETGLFIAGFGQIRRLEAAQLTCPQTALDAIEAAEPALLAAMNKDHDVAATRLAHAAGKAGRWRMLGLDPDGLDLAQDETVLRIAFPAPVQDAEGVRTAIGQLLA